MKRIGVLLIAIFLTGCNQSPPHEDIQANNVDVNSLDASAPAPNILLIVGDDFGVETLAKYGIGNPVAHTPVLDRLAEEGMVFENFYTPSTCTPTRAAILTGRYGFRTGVNMPIPEAWYLYDGLTPPPVPPGANKEIIIDPMGERTATSFRLPEIAAEKQNKGPNLSEVMLPEALKTLAKPYATGGFGKWHLGSTNNGDFDHPNLSGLDHFTGFGYGSPNSFFAWMQNTNGKVAPATGYADQRTTDEAAAWIKQQKDPWFAWVGYANAHVPQHLPPKELLKSQARNLDPEAITFENTQPYFLAQIEAMDTLIGQLLDSIPEDVLANTYIFFLGDNGTLRFSQPPAPVDPKRAKMTPYEGGIHTPFIVKGPSISSGRASSALVNSVDLFASIIELAGGTVTQAVPSDVVVDSVSFVPLLKDDAPAQLRKWVQTPGGMAFGLSHTIRNEKYKLIRASQSGREQLYNLSKDPWEKTDLITSESEEVKINYNTLKSQLDLLLASKN